MAPPTVGENGWVPYLPDDTYALVERSMPIACVDFVPRRDTARGVEVGLILRESPFGRVWCHLGGRVQRGETIAAAIQRHALDTLATRAVLTSDPQPDYVYQWFPPEITPDDGIPYGVDPRKHAIGLSFVVAIEGAPQPRNEAIDFAFFPLDELPDPLWPGSGYLIDRMLVRPVPKHTA